MSSVSLDTFLASRYIARIPTTGAREMDAANGTSLPLDEAIARKVLCAVDAGLVSGLGRREPGHMCVEAAVCYAYDLPHSDRPPCVGDAVRAFKIRLNDARWSSNEARTAGLRALAIAQLGSDVVDQEAFRRLVVEGTIRRVVPMALEAAARRACEPHAQALKDAAERCKREGTIDSVREARDVARRAYAAAAADAAAYAAAAAAYAAAAAAYADAAAAAYAADAADADAAACAADAARDKVLNVAADVGLQALKDLKSPGCEYLYLLAQGGAA